MEKTVFRLGMLNCDFARTTLVTCLNRQCHEIDIFTSFITLTVITVITGEFGSSASWSLVRLSVDNDTGRSHESPDVPNSANSKNIKNHESQVHQDQVGDILLRNAQKSSYENMEGH